MSSALTPFIKEVPAESLISLYTKSLDVQAKAAILLAVPRNSEELGNYSLAWIEVFTN